MEKLKIYRPEAEGYVRLHEDDPWCIASVCDTERIRAAGLHRLERHLETDEAFVLLHGSATLYLGEELQPEPMVPELVYVVPKGMWHTITTEPDSRLLIMERSNTSPANTEYWRDLNHANL